MRQRQPAHFLFAAQAAAPDLRKERLTLEHNPNNELTMLMDEKAMAHTEAIILSMTPKEREKPEIIGASRKKRIAAGAGLKVEDVNRLLKSFEQMRKLIKQFSGPGAGKKMKRMGRMGGFGGFPGF